jgi:succinate dehydrogenase hydrophobic anchor subunit
MRNMKSEVGYWTFFIIAGIVVFVLLSLHMMIVHMDGFLGLFNPAGGSSLDWKNVIYRSHSAFFTIIYIILLAAALYHGFYGLRTILFELGLKESVERFVTIAVWVIGIVLFCVGLYANFAIHTVKAAV